MFFFLNSLLVYCVSMQNTNDTKRRLLFNFTVYIFAGSFVVLCVKREPAWYVNSSLTAPGVKAAAGHAGCPAPWGNTLQGKGPAACWVPTETSISLPLSTQELSATSPQLPATSVAAGLPFSETSRGHLGTLLRAALLEQGPQWSPLMPSTQCFWKAFNKTHTFSKHLRVKLQQKSNLVRDLLSDFL